MLAETCYIILSTTFHCWGPFFLISHILQATYFEPPNHVFPTMHTQVIPAAMQHIITFDTHKAGFFPRGLNTYLNDADI